MANFINPLKNPVNPKDYHLTIDEVDNPNWYDILFTAKNLKTGVTWEDHIFYPLNEKFSDEYIEKNIWDIVSQREQDLANRQYAQSIGRDGKINEMIGIKNGPESLPDQYSVTPGGLILAKY